MPPSPHRPDLLAWQVFRGSDVVRDGLLTRHQLRSNAWLRLGHDVYADARLPRDHGLACQAAALFLPPGAVIAGPSAAYLHGVEHAAAFETDVHVLTRQSARMTARKGVRVHTTNLSMPLPTLGSASGARMSGPAGGPPGGTPDGSGTARTFVPAVSARTLRPTGSTGPAGVARSAGALHPSAAMAPAGTLALVDAADRAGTGDRRGASDRAGTADRAGTGVMTGVLGTATAGTSVRGGVPGGRGATGRAEALGRGGAPATVAALGAPGAPATAAALGTAGAPATVEAFGTTGAPATAATLGVPGAIGRHGVVLDARGVAGARGEVPKSVPAWAAWETAAWLDPVRAVGIVDTMLALGLTTRAELVDLAGRHLDRPGGRQVLQVFELADPGAQSPPESYLRVRLVLAGLPRPVTQHPVRLPSGLALHPDLAWPDFQVAVEYDGQWHADPEQLHRDRQRLHQMVGAGWLVLHVTGRRLRHDFPAVLREVHAALSARGWRR